MSVKLEMPDLKYWESYERVFETIDLEGSVKGMNWDGKSTPDTFIQDARDMKEGRNLGELVPCTNFWIISNEEYVGRMSIRHELNDWLRNFGGHIGYEVIESARKKGHASRAMSLALGYCKDELNLKNLLITCDDRNTPSIRVIEKNNGKLIEKRDVGNGRISRYYEIVLS